MEFVLIRRELDRLPRQAAEEFEREFKSNLVKMLEEAVRGGHRAPEVAESVDASGNRVFRFSGDFNDVRELYGDYAKCSFQGQQRGTFRAGSQLRCQFVKNMDSDVPIPTTLRIRMPGTIESTNGTKQTDDEALWKFPRGFQRGARIEVTAVHSAIPQPYALAGGAVVAVLLLGGGWLVMRHRRTTSRESDETDYAAPPASRPPGDAMQACVACGARNDRSARFCRACGARLSVSLEPLGAAARQRHAGDTAALCRNCGADNRIGARFCRECGSPMETEGAVAVGATNTHLSR
jgi:ribosomal protein L40E